MEIRLIASKLNFKIDKSKVLQNILDFNLGSTLTEIFDVNPNIESKAFYLLFNVAKKTNIELSKVLGQDKINNSKDLIITVNNFEQEWKDYLEQEITITRDFFEDIVNYNPDYLKKAFKLFEAYLKSLDISIPNNYYYVYYMFFNKNLIDEFQNGKENYRELVDFFDNPIYHQNEKLEFLINRYIEINSYYTNPLQSDVVECVETLKDLYIEPNFKVFRRNLYHNQKHPDEFISIEKDINIHEYLNNYFLKGEQILNSFRDNYNMLFILGQPGQGKTSFCYRLIYDILENSIGLPDPPLYFIKIRDLHAKDFINDTFNTINNSIGQNIDFTSEKCLLILDGLDEAYMSGGLTDNDLKNLYERLNKACRNNKNLKIILTSRLNYLNLNDPSIEGSLVIKLDFLKDEQIKLYVSKFVHFYPDNLLFKKIDTILKEPEFYHIKELLQQPVLMYFIALSNINLDKNDSKAAVYNKIFDSLAKRSWDKKGQLAYIKSELKDDYKKYSKYLRQYIRSLAFEIYQSPDLHISLKKLVELESTKQFIRKCFNEDISTNSEKIKEVSKYLLISFYFQQSNKNQEEDTAIEFFHNSLWEFLTAEYIWEENKRIVLSEDEDNELKALRVDEYFHLLNRLIGSKDLKSEVKFNLENIIKLESIEVQQKVYTQTTDVFYKLVEKHILLYYDWKNENLTSKEKTQNIFDLLWCFIHTCNLSLGGRIKTNDYINDYIFTATTNHTYKNTFMKINFYEDVYFPVYINACSIVDVLFDFAYLDIFDINSCILNNTIFNNLDLENDFSKNTFLNVIFKDVIISKDFKFSNNILRNCKFDNVRIPSRSWLSKISKYNDLDEEFLKNHKIVSKRNQYGILSYYTVYEIS